MCGDHPGACGPTRRELVARASRWTAAATGAAALGSALTSTLGTARAALADDIDRGAPTPVPVAPGLTIHPREAWGADLAPTGPILPETPQFLLVHHTASPSSYGDARDVIRGVYRFHTGPAKGWADVCYQFFVGRDGDVWEGRAGALAGPVVADASNGSQGFAQLVCLLGDFQVAPPTPAALDALVRVLAWLARRDGIDVAPGATATFRSRGSDRWRAGTTVTTPTIAGHRDMTYTACPGAAMYALLPAVREQVALTVARWAAPPAPGPDGLRPAQRIGRVADPEQPDT